MPGVTLNATAPNSGNNDVHLRPVGTPAGKPAKMFRQKTADAENAKARRVGARY